MQIARLTQVKQVKLETGESSYKRLTNEEAIFTNTLRQKENISDCLILGHLYFRFSSSNKRKSC